MTALCAVYEAGQHIVPCHASGAGHVDAPTRENPVRPLPEFTPDRAVDMPVCGHLIELPALDLLLAQRAGYDSL